LGGAWQEAAVEVEQPLGGAEQEAAAELEQPSTLKTDFVFRAEFCMLANPLIITNKVWIL